MDRNEFHNPPVEKKPLINPDIERMKQQLDEGSKRIGKQLEDGEIGNQEFKRQILALIDTVTNPKHE